MPLLTPHPKKGGPSANNLILSITVSSLPFSEPKITYLSPPSPSPFYIFLAPLSDDWTNSLTHFFPNQTLDFAEIPLTELTISTLFCFIIEPISAPFPIPSFHSQPPSISPFGWINVSSFTSAKVLYLVSSQSHLNLLHHFLQEHSSLFSAKVTIGQASCIDLAFSSHTPSQVPEPQDFNMTTNEDVSQEPFPEYSPFLLLSYRILSYFSWESTFDHPRQRLLEAVAGGLHLSTPTISSLLREAIATFSLHFFDPITSILPLFIQLSLTLPRSLRLTMFPQGQTDSESQSLYSVSLPTFPIVHDSDTLRDSFKNIFLYIPANQLFIWTQPTLLFSSPNMLHTTLSIYLDLLGKTFTVTDPAKQRTSQNNRPIVLKFYAFLLECNAVSHHPQSNLHLVIEEFQPDLSSVKVYDPFLGSHIVPLRDLSHLSVTGLVFKRSSQTHLICPKLLQRFTALALPKQIAIHRSPFSIISLFDGSGSFTDVIAKALEAWPHAILAAENDAGTRAVVSKVKGWPMDGALRTLDKNGAQTFYAQDVWSLITNHFLLSRQFLSLLPEDSVIFLAAGSPCPDLTIRPPWPCR